MRCPICTYNKYLACTIFTFTIIVFMLNCSEWSGVEWSGLIFFSWSRFYEAVSMKQFLCSSMWHLKYQKKIKQARYCFIFLECNSSIRGGLRTSNVGFPSSLYISSATLLMVGLPTYTGGYLSMISIECCTPG